MNYSKKDSMLIWGGGILILLIMLYVLNKYFNKEYFYGLKRGTQPKVVAAAATGKASTVKGS